MTFLATNSGPFDLRSQDFTDVRFGQGRATADSRFATLDVLGVKITESGRYSLRFSIDVDAYDGPVNVALKLWLYASSPGILGTFTTRFDLYNRRLEPKATLEVDLVAGDILSLQAFHDAGYTVQGRYLVLEVERIT